jgi:hypothetical protein
VKLSTHNHLVLRARMVELYVLQLLNRNNFAIPLYNSTPGAVSYICLFLCTSVICKDMKMLDIIYISSMFCSNISKNFLSDNRIFRGEGKGVKRYFKPPTAVKKMLSFTTLFITRCFMHFICPNMVYR